MNKHIPTLRPLLLLGTIAISFCCISASDGRAPYLPDRGAMTKVSGWYDRMGPWGKIRSLRLGEDGSARWISEAARGADLDLVEGTCEFKDGMIFLSPTKDVQRRAEPLRLIPIAWRETIYLVPPELLFFFSYAVMSNEPQTTVGGGMYVRDGREKKSATLVPPLRSQKIKGLVTQVSDNSTALIELETPGSIVERDWLAVGGSVNQGWGTSVQVTSISGNTIEVRLNRPRELAKGDRVIAMIEMDTSSRIRP